MSLQKQLLFDQLIRITRSYSESSNVTANEIANGWSKAYQTYVRNAIAGPLSIIPGTDNPSIIATSILSAPTDFFHGLSKGLEEFWTGVAFFGPGYIPINPCTPGNFSAFLIEPMLKEMELFGSLDEAINEIATILHTYTSKILVTTTTTTIPPIVFTLQPIE